MRHAGRAASPYYSALTDAGFALEPKTQEPPGAVRPGVQGLRTSVIGYSGSPDIGIGSRIRFSNSSDVNRPEPPRMRRAPRYRES